MPDADRLKISLSPAWEAIEGASSIPTFMRRGRSNNNALQISWSSISRDQTAGVDLIAFAVDWAESIGGVVRRQFGGDSVIGKFGSAIFDARDFAYCQVWTVSDGVDFFQATLICDGEPSDAELAEAHQMAVTLQQSKEPHAPPKKRWWSF